MEKTLSNQISLQMLHGLTQEDLSQLYTHATQLFNTGLYGAAASIYGLLAQADRGNIEYWLALGLCHQRLEKGEEAIGCFDQAAKMTADDPRPAFFAGVTYRMSGQHDLARQAFDLTLQRCGEQQQYQGIRCSAAQLLAHSILENTVKHDG